MATPRFRGENDSGDGPTAAPSNLQRSRTRDIDANRQRTRTRRRMLPACHDNSPSMPSAITPVAAVRATVPVGRAGHDRAFGIDGGRGSWLVIHNT
jgi:hypothetical protein